MSGGFANPLVGGGGALVYPSVHSPDFAHDVSGWSIGKDGSAEFNNVTVRGTFAGLDYEITSTGAFFYAGSPATGNLLVSIARTSGTDSYGNTYPGGVTAFDTAGDWISLGGGLVADLVFGIAGNTAYDTDFYRYQPVSPGPTFLRTSAGMVIDKTLTATGGTAADPTVISTDSWHSVAVTGWSGTLYYRLSAENEVMLAGTFTTPASGVNGTAIATLPAGDRPENVAAPFNGTHTGTTNFGETFTLGTGGGLVPSGFGTSATVHLAGTRIPLDIP